MYYLLVSGFENLILYAPSPLYFVSYKPNISALDKRLFCIGTLKEDI